MQDEEERDLITTQKGLALQKQRAPNVQAGQGDKVPKTASHKAWFHTPHNSLGLFYTEPTKQSHGKLRSWPSE